MAATWVGGSEMAVMSREFYRSIVTYLDKDLCSRERMPSLRDHFKE